MVVFLNNTIHPGLKFVLPSSTSHHSSVSPPGTLAEEDQVDVAASDPQLRNP